MSSSIGRPRRLAFLAVLASALAAPAAAQTHPPAAPGGSFSIVSTEPASVRWNRLAQELSTGHAGGGMASRPLAVLSVAQWNAAEHAPDASTIAVAAASAEVLAYLYPQQATRFSDALDRERVAARQRGIGQGPIAAADSIGRVAASRAVARAGSDSSGAPWHGTVPTGSGIWSSAEGAHPVGAVWGQIRPWLLGSPGAVRPPAPPAVGSSEFAAQIDEVRKVTAARTPEQLRIARHWAPMPMPAYWNATALGIIARHELSEERAARTLAALNVALMDANIACFEAKYTYWSIRPSQADSTIGVPVALPNFPAYPSGHACLSGAAAEVLAHYFPAMRVELDRTADEVAMSRLHAGVHYRSDNDVGLDMGRRVARLVLEALSEGGSGLVP